MSRETVTVYVTDGIGVNLFLWADGDAETIAAALAVGHSLETYLREWHAYPIDWDQWALAVADGAEIVDRWEPALQYARRMGDRPGLISAILTHRLRAA